MPATPPHRQGRRFRFERASVLVSGRVKAAGEGRGFSAARVVTHWEEVVGPDLAPLARPLKVTYARKGIGATLVLLSTGARAPMVEMAKETIRQRVNAVYGYAAISKIRITQTAPEGFGGMAEEAAPFELAPSPEVEAEARAAADGTSDPGLRAALEDLGRAVLGRRGRT